MMPAMAAALVAMGVAYMLSRGGNYETVSLGGEKLYRVRAKAREALYKRLVSYTVTPTPGPWPGSLALACKVGEGNQYNLWAYLVNYGSTTNVALSVQDVDALLRGESPQVMTGYTVPHSLSEEVTSSKQFAMVIGPDVLGIASSPKGQDASANPLVPGGVPGVNVPVPGVLPDPPYTTPPIYNPPGGTGLPTIPENGIPSSPDVLDASMDPLTRAMTYDLLVTAGTVGGASPEGLDLGAKGLVLKGWPISAAYCTKRAAWLRKHPTAVPGPVPATPVTPPARTPPRPPTGQPGTPPTVQVPPTPAYPPPTPPAMPPGYPPGPAVPPPVVQQTATMRILEGHIPWKVAQYYTGDPMRWKELPAANGDINMVVYKDSKGNTQLKPWNVGTMIKLPDSWGALGKPPPTPLSTPSTTTPPTSVPKDNAEDIVGPGGFPGGEPDSYYDPDNPDYDYADPDTSDPDSPFPPINARLTRSRTVRR